MIHELARQIRRDRIILSNGHICAAWYSVLSRAGHFPIDRRFAAFAWNTKRVDGHNVDEMKSALSPAPAGDAPRAVVARVKMAAGVSPWQDQAKWHGTTPDRNSARRALEEIGLAEGYDDANVKICSSHGAVTAEEHSVLGGLGGAIAETLSSSYPVPLERVGVQDTYGESGEPDEILEAYGLTSHAIVASALKVVDRKRNSTV